MDYKDKIRNAMLLLSTYPLTDIRYCNLVNTRSEIHRLLLTKDGFVFGDSDILLNMHTLSDFIEDIEKFGDFIISDTHYYELKKLFN